MIHDPYTTSTVDSTSFKKLISGRKSDLENIIDRLSQGKSIALFGERRIGKTSTLWLIRDIINGSINDYKEQLWDATLKEWLNNFQNSQHPPMKSEFLTLQSGSFRSFDDLLTKLRSLFPSSNDNTDTSLFALFTRLNRDIDSRLIILIDEMEILLEEQFTDSELVFRQLNSVIQKCENISFIFAGADIWMQTIKDGSSPISGNCLQIPLSVPESDPIKYFLLGEGLKEQFSDEKRSEIISQIIEQTGCKPFYCQMIASEIVSHKKSIDDALSNRTIHQQTLHFFDDLPEPNKSILSLLAHYPNISKKEIAIFLSIQTEVISLVLSDMQILGKILLKETRYSLNGKFFEVWGKENLPPPDLKKSFDNISEPERSILCLLTHYSEISQEDIELLLEKTKREITLLLDKMKAEEKIVFNTSCYSLNDKILLSAKNHLPAPNIKDFYDKKPDLVRSVLQLLAHNNNISKEEIAILFNHSNQSISNLLEQWKNLFEIDSGIICLSQKSLLGKWAKNNLPPIDIREIFFKDPSETASYILQLLAHNPKTPENTIVAVLKKPSDEVAKILEDLVRRKKIKLNDKESFLSKQTYSLNGKFFEDYGTNNFSRLNLISPWFTKIGYLLALLSFLATIYIYIYVNPLTKEISYNTESCILYIKMPNNVERGEEGTALLYIVANIDLKSAKLITNHNSSVFLSEKDKENTWTFRELKKNQLPSRQEAKFQISDNIKEREAIFNLLLQIFDEKQELKESKSIEHKVPLRYFAFKKYQNFITRLGLFLSGVFATLATLATLWNTIKNYPPFKLINKYFTY